MAEALGDVDLSDPQSFADPEVLEKLDELEDTFDETYEEAGETVSDYIDENCTLRRLISPRPGRRPSRPSPGGATAPRSSPRPWPRS